MNKQAPRVILSERREEPMVRFWLAGEGERIRIMAVHSDDKGRYQTVAHIEWRDDCFVLVPRALHAEGLCQAFGIHPGKIVKVKVDPNDQCTAEAYSVKEVVA